MNHEPQEATDTSNAFGFFLLPSYFPSVHDGIGMASPLTHHHYDRTAFMHKPAKMCRA
jgi:hypothetical protein